MNLEKTGVGKITGVLAAGGVLIYLLSSFYPLFRACPLNITEFENLVSHNYVFFDFL